MSYIQANSMPPIGSRAGSPPVQVAIVTGAPWRLALYAVSVVGSLAPREGGSAASRHRPSYRPG